jgi:LEA14-like dessication related protein
MVKKALIIGGVGLAGYGLYRYFKYQVDLAMKYDYKIKNFKYLGINGNDVKVSATIQITNKSSFRLIVNSFDLDLYYEGKKFADVISTKPVTIEPNSSFDITGIGVINVNDIKVGLPQFLSDVLKQKPIEIEVIGQLKINFMNVNSTINFNREKFTYSTDLISEYGFGDKYSKLKQKYSNIFNFFGIK